MVDVNRYTLQHNQFENIFAIGDAVDEMGSDLFDLDYSGVY